jgi:hypothetical protein
LGITELDETAAVRTMSAVLKYEEDRTAVSSAGLGAVVGSGQ